MTSEKSTIKYFGWSCFELAFGNQKLYFDPMSRKYCGVQWTKLEDFKDTNVICVTHGHQEHYQDVPAVAKFSGATVVSSPTACKHLNSFYGLDKKKLITIEPYEDKEVEGFKISAFLWRHRDVSPIKAVFRPKIWNGIKWAWNGLLKCAYNAPFTGFFIEMPDGLKILNYNEGFTYNMEIDEVREVADHYKPDILLAGAQMDFENYVAAGAEIFDPKIVVLYHPHKALFEQINVSSTTPEKFSSTVQSKLPNAEIFYAEPGWTYN
jgi:L-ascorbate metabolism protein UlaG (beta-lactamase superfamily)